MYCVLIVCIAMHAACAVCHVGGSSFGVSLLGGVRDSSGQLRTFVTFVDERHNHEGGIKEGVCTLHVYEPYYITYILKRTSGHCIQNQSGH